MECKKSRAIFRVDGGAGIGLGHIMRCLNLADGLKEKNIQSIFITKDNNSEIEKHIVNYLVEKLPSHIDLKEDLELTINLIKKHQPDLVITDSYEIDEYYLEQMKKLNGTLISIDDLSKLHFCSDMVLNQNIGFKDSDYSTEGYTRLLLGTKYALLRKEFGEKHCLEKEIKSVAGNILITLGGTDIDNQTVKVIRAIKTIEDNLIATVIMGPAYQYEEILNNEIKGTDGQFILRRNPQDIFALMMNTDVAISAGGSTCYELACLGVPNIILILADNQKKVANGLANYGTSVNLGWFEEVTEEQIKEAVEDLIKNRDWREKMSRKGKELVDGRGVKRVVEEIWSLLE